MDAEPAEPTASAAERVATAIADALDESAPFMERWAKRTGAASELCTIAREGSDEEAAAAIEGLGTIAKRHPLAAMADRTIDDLTILSTKFRPDEDRYLWVMTQIEEALQATRIPE